MNTYRADIRRFIEGERKNMWIEYPNFRIYVRKGFHTLPPFRAFKDTFDIANISVDEASQGKGIFTEWLTAAEDIAKEFELTPYVENLLNPRLAQWLSRRGYCRMGPVELPSYFIFS